MAFYAFGGAESDDDFDGVYNLVSVDADDVIVGSPGAFPGAYSYEIDPVNGVPITEKYGWWAPLSTPSLLTVMFMYRFAANFDASIAIAELNDTVNYARRITQTNDERLQILDADGDLIAQTAINYVAANTDYWILWYVDLVGATRDILWVWLPNGAGAWDKAIDVAGHGDGDPAHIDRITFGSSVGKGLPTVGGPFYVDEMAVQVLNEEPNTDPIGSVTTRLKMPTANGADGDFDTGSGVGAHPDWQLVDEIPQDGNTSYDEGDVQGDKQSYEIANANGGETPLAVQILGAAGQGVLGQPNISAKSYIYDGASRDYSDVNLFGHGYFPLASKTYNEVNGTAITESRFNDDFEAGIEITSLSGSSTLRLSQIGLGYIVAGPKALPDDFPVAVPVVGWSQGHII